MTGEGLYCQTPALLCRGAQATLGLMWALALVEILQIFLSVVWEGGELFQGIWIWVGGCSILIEIPQNRLQNIE